MTEGWLVYRREDYEKNRAFADLFVALCHKYDLNIELKFPEEISIAVRSGCVAALSEEGGPSPKFVINRTRDHRLARCFEQAGCRVFNSSEAARIGNDKIESHLLAARLGLPQVDMTFCENTPGCVARHRLAYPIVLKNSCGHGGSEVFLARDEAELIRFASGLACGSVLIQRLCGRPGVDVRVYVMGNKVLRAVKRFSGSDFRANLSLGGAVEPYELDDEVQSMAGRILSALRLDYAGIDFIMDREGRLLFNEIEDVVGSRSLYRLGGVDVVGLFLNHIRETICGISQ